MMRETFETLVLEYLKDEILKFDICGENEITLNLKDINFKKECVDWDVDIEEYLNKHNYNVHFEYGNENWVTIYKI